MLEPRWISLVINVNYGWCVHRLARFSTNQNSLELWLLWLNLSSSVEIFIFQSFFNVKECTFCRYVVVDYISSIQINCLLEYFFNWSSICNSWCKFFFPFCRIIIKKTGWILEPRVSVWLCWNGFTKSRNQREWIEMSQILVSKRCNSSCTWIASKFYNTRFVLRYTLQTHLSFSSSIWSANNILCWNFRTRSNLKSNRTSLHGNFAITATSKHFWPHAVRSW